MTADALDLLLVGNDDEGLGTLALGLTSLGYRIDRVTDLRGVRGAFFAAGGHDAVIFGPGLAPAAGEVILRDLRNIDRQLRLVVFSGFEHEPISGAQRICGLHPATQSALGAVHRALRL